MLALFMYLSEISSYVIRINFGTILGSLIGTFLKKSIFCFHRKFDFPYIVYAHFGKIFSSKMYLTDYVRGGVLNLNRGPGILFPNWDLSYFGQSV